MDRERTERTRAEDSMDLSGPFGTRVSVKGKDAVSALLIIFCALCLAYMMYRHDMSSAEAATKLAVDQKELGQKLEEMVYVISLPEVDRQALNLKMPDSLRQKISHEGR